jgi:hypothetical protein
VATRSLSKIRPATRSSCSSRRERAMYRRRNRLDQLHVVSEQRLEPSKVALLDGREEPSGQFVALLARRTEARPALLDVASGAGCELAHVVLALADDRRDLRIPIVEHVVKQQRGPLLGRQALQQHQQRQRQRIGRLSLRARPPRAICRRVVGPAKRSG